GDSAVAIIMKHINEPVPPLITADGTLNRAMEAVVLRAMAKEPADRYQDVAAMMDDFDNAIAGKTTAASLELISASRIPRTTVIVPAQPQARRRLPIIPAAVVVVIVVAVALFIVLKARNDAQVADADQGALLSPPGAGSDGLAPSMTSGPL